MPSPSAIEHELRMVGSLLDYGMASLQRATPKLYRNYPDDPPFVNLLLLSNAIERLGKCVLWAEGYVRGDPPDVSQWGHDVNRIVADIHGRCFPEDMLDNEQVRSDRQILGNDPLVHDYANLLTEFAGPDTRYFYLDSASEDPPVDPEESPEEKFYAFESKLIEQRTELPTQEVYNTNDIPPVIYARRLIPKRTAFVERFIRTISRPLAPSILGWEAYRLSSGISHWADLPDDALGQTWYAARIPGFLKRPNPDYERFEPKRTAYRADRLRDYPHT